jgi:long-chain acyl-CoA synthetase
MGIELSEQANLSDLFLGRITATPDRPAYRQFVSGAWCDWTWRDIGHEVGRWQAALARADLKSGDRVGVCLHNSVEWVLFDQAAIGLGFVTVPLYFDDRPDNMAWCLNDAGVRLLLLENGEQWTALKDHVKTVEQVVIVGGTIPVDTKVKRLADWLPKQVQAPARSPAAPNDLMTIVYTSGTTGRPKGVMLSHRNILSNVVSAMRAIPVYTTDRFLSFLPLSHMFERTCGYYAAIWAGGHSVYARSITQLAEDMDTQKPTVLIAVPRIFERIWARMQEAMPPGTPKRKLFDKAVEVGWRRFQGQMTVNDKLLWPILKVLVAKTLRARLGGRVRMISIGGAAFAPQHARIFIGLGLNILQGYGLTETSPVVAANREGDNDPFTVGRPFDGISVRCDEKGELLVRGPCVMLGYWNNPQATEAVIDKEGWFHAGDLARIRDGRISITGRVKDVIVMSNGEKVPPGDAEQAIMLDPIFEQVLLIGEGRPKLGLLCVAKSKDLRELCARANARLREFPGYVRINHIAGVDTAWSIENGLLTPTLKTRREEIEKRYAKVIETMYTDSSACVPKS